MEKKIFLGGLGGQGVVLAGKMMGMASVNAGGYATSYSEYAPAMRNGYTYTTVIIADKEIGAQVTEAYDYMVFFDEDSCVKQKHCLKQGGIYIINSSLVNTMPDIEKGKILKIAASEIADELGNARLLNVIILGAIVAASEAVDKEQEENVILSIFGKKPNIAELNIIAFRRGMEEIYKQISDTKGENR